MSGKLASLGLSLSPFRGLGARHSFGDHAAVSLDASARVSPDRLRPIARATVALQAGADGSDRAGVAALLAFAARSTSAAERLKGVAVVAVGSGPGVGVAATGWRRLSGRLLVRGPDGGRRINHFEGYRGMARLAGRTVLVTGASRGIGLATARRFHMEGARVGLVARDPDRLASVVADLDGSCCAVAADVAAPGDCVRAVDEIERALGPVDVLVSNAGVLRRDFVSDVKVEDFEESYRVNVGAALWLTKRVLPGMRERGYGRIVLVASELGLFGGPSYASYCMSKFALVGLAEVLWHELAGSDVRACAVCPGDVRTDQLDQEHRWGPTGGVPPEKAMSPDYLATAIVRSLDSRNPVVIVDRPHLRAVFNLWGGPRRLRLAAVHGAYKELLKT